MPMNENLPRALRTEKEHEHPDPGADLVAQLRPEFADWRLHGCSRLKK
jgi:hypothetical protein